MKFFANKACSGYGTRRGKGSRLKLVSKSADGPDFRRIVPGKYKENAYWAISPSYSPLPPSSGREKERTRGALTYLRPQDVRALYISAFTLCLIFCADGLRLIQTTKHLIGFKDDFFR